jgi:uncharacterized RDD family membrane protein YckC
MNWHYVENGQRTGPVDEIRFQELIRAGKINSQTLVWREGMADWIPYGQTPEANSAATTSSTPIGIKPEAVCAECGKLFPKDEMIQHGAAYICAGCKPVFMQKLSEGAQIKTDELNYAGIGTRFAAVFLDGLIVGVFNFGLGLILGVAGAQAARDHSSGFLAIQFVVFAIELAVGATYEGVMVGKYGATLGKMACKIKVVTADGGRVSYARAFGRYFAKMLSAFTCLIGYIIAIFDKPQRRALHDHICNTRVIYK